MGYLQVNHHESGRVAGRIERAPLSAARYLEGVSQSATLADSASHDVSKLSGLIGASWGHVPSPP